MIFIAQLVKSLQTVVSQLEQAENERNVELFSRLKREAIRLHKKIDEAL